MHIDFYFKNINSAPTCEIVINSQKKYSGPVVDCVPIDTNDVGKIKININFINKLPSDTVVDNSGNIVADKNFELDRIIVDGYSLEELIWDSVYLSTSGEKYSSCLFFGPPGYFDISIENPVLPWILKTRHEKYNNDPDWETDYNYYVTACNILQQI
jgi:hypothetical protein